MIEQILNNALKYARGKDIWITFNNENHVLSIRDNGVGISKADLPKIFDKGYSAITEDFINIQVASDYLLLNIYRHIYIIK